MNFIKVGEINTVKETFDAELMIKARWRVATLDGKVVKGFKRWKQRDADEQTDRRQQIDGPTDRRADRDVLYFSPGDGVQIRGDIIHGLSLYCVSFM